MADENTTEETQPTDEAPNKPRSNTGLIVMFVGMVVVLETGMFFFLVPSAEQVSALAEAELIQSVQEGAEQAEQELTDENREVEFDLGAFGETFSPIETERTFRVELKLYGIIRKKNVEKMTKEFDDKNGRLRHAIRMKIRNSELQELTDNQLGLLQRRILTTCNHLLDEDLLLGIGFQEFQLIEE
ncbi:dihydrolipoamide acetyltransferase [Rhodopirellula sp. JC740]|uniref:Dihydrolipoamide acetyltransferase n=1 Tax=Rhodopirellula halodulae TaxID=2894198 RepID=A0ABS8NJI1_9BACT|nr:MULTISPECIES: dihydrolipoamide acetyltransferase [unclassified Rhodopirellula]MCC9643715.1 dihydrolipoamide acetyltransferase [Rhodopirellula sp. JC740]MCC9656879.1 dihydrolipoamide acetyltransferase [Rhodopirellula sp. JC737]